MDKKAKKKLDIVHQRLQKLRQQLAGARKQNDDPAQLAQLEQEVKRAEAELDRLRAG